MNKCKNCGDMFFGSGSYCDDCKDELWAGDEMSGEVVGFFQFPAASPNQTFNYQCPNCRGLYNTPGRGKDVQNNICFVCPFCGLPYYGFPARDPLGTPGNDQEPGENDDFIV